MKQKVFRGVLWSLIQKWGSRGISLIVFFVLARLLDAETFGLIAFASVFIAFTEIFIDQGFSDAIIQRESVDSGHLDTAFWTNICIGTILTLTGFLTADLLANAVRQPELGPILRWLSLSFIFTSLTSVQQAILRRTFDFKSLAKRSLLAQIFAGTTGVCLAFLGFGVWSLVAQQLTGALVGVVVLWQVSSWRPGFNVSVERFRELSGFGISILGFSFLNFLNKRTDDLLIGFYLGPTQLGYYTVAYRILLLMMELLVGVISEVALPTFSRLQDNLETLRNALYRSTQITILISLPAFLLVSVLAPEIVETLFGVQWMPSVPVMQVLSFIGIIQAVTQFNGSVLVAVGKPSWKFWLGCLNTTVNIVLFSLVVRWGIVFVALAYVVRGYLIMPISISLIKRVTKISIKKYFQQYATPVIASFFMIAAIVGIKSMFYEFLTSSALVVLIVSVPAGLIVYAGSIRLIDSKLFQYVLDMVMSYPRFRNGST